MTTRSPRTPWSGPPIEAQTDSYPLRRMLISAEQRSRIAPLRSIAPTHIIQTIRITATAPAKDAALSRKALIAGIAYSIVPAVAATVDQVATMADPDRRTAKHLLPHANK
jgi:hypothetical protein